MRWGRRVEERDWTGGRRSFIVSCHCADPQVPMFDHDRSDDDGHDDTSSPVVGDFVGSQSLTLPSNEIKTGAAEPHAMPGPFYEPASNS